MELKQVDLANVLVRTISAIEEDLLYLGEVVEPYRPPAHLEGDAQRFVREPKKLASDITSVDIGRLLLTDRLKIIGMVVADLQAKLAGAKAELASL